MQENEFEKQVQQKMEELKLNPSAAVWENIELKIKKEKQHRRGFILLPMLIVCFSLLGYWIWNLNVSRENHQHKFSNNKIVKKNDAGKMKSILTPENNRIATIEERKFKVDLVQTKKFTDTKNLSQKISSVHLNKSSKVGLAIKPKVNVKIIRPDVVEIFEDKIPLELQKETINESNKTILAINETGGIISTGDSLADNISDDLKNKEADKLIEDNKKISPKRVIKKESLFSWGFVLSTGKSSVADKFLAAEDKSFDARNYNNVIPNSGSIGNPVFQPSIIKSSTALVAGFFIKKSIMKNIALKTGLNYKLLGTANKVGADSLVYYRSQNAKNSHHNNFHFIELPLTFQFQPGSVKKMPLLFDIGFSISHLTGSNALQFNPTSGIYYHDNSLFNKTFLNANAGLSVSLFSKQKTSLLIGPYIFYDVTKIAKKGLYSSKHFTSIELRAQLRFQKK